MRKLHTSKLQGIFCIAAGILCNKFLIEFCVSQDGAISSLSVNIGIILFQIILIVTGILYITQKYDLLETVGLVFLLLFIGQFWIQIFFELPHPEKRMYQALPFSRSLLKAGWHYQDQISAYEARFQDVKTFLPPIGVIGYTASLDIDEEQTTLYRGLAQYTLAPLVLRNSTTPSLVIGDFPEIRKHSPIYSSKLRIFKEFERGVILFQEENE